MNDALLFTLDDLLNDLDNLDNIDNENLENLKNNILKVMSNGEFWRLNDIVTTCNSDILSVNQAIEEILEEKSNFVEVSHEVYQYKLANQEGISQAVESLETTKNCVIAIGSEINPITMTKADVGISNELKKALVKLDECQKILEDLV